MRDEDPAAPARVDRGLKLHRERQMSNCSSTGTCHDIHEMKLADIHIKRTRQQLLSVLAHSLVTIFTVDTERRVTMLEGSLIWNLTAEDDNDGSSWYDGQDIYAVFNRLTNQRHEDDRPKWLQSIEDILDGRVKDKNKELVKEHGFGERVDDSFPMITPS